MKSDKDPMMKKTASAISRGLTKTAARFRLPVRAVGKTLIKPVTPFKPTRTGRIASGIFTGGTLAGGAGAAKLTHDATMADTRNYKGDVLKPTSTANKIYNQAVNETREWLARAAVGEKGIQRLDGIKTIFGGTTPRITNLQPAYQRRHGRLGSDFTGRDWPLRPPSPSTLVTTPSKLDFFKARLARYLINIGDKHTAEAHKRIPGTPEHAENEKLRPAAHALWSLGNNLTDYARVYSPPMNRIMHPEEYRDAADIFKLVYDRDMQRYKDLLRDTGDL